LPIGQNFHLHTAQTAQRLSLGVPRDLTVLCGRKELPHVESISQILSQMTQQTALSLCVLILIYRISWESQCVFSGGQTWYISFCGG
jgi:hypothetical protein